MTAVYILLSHFASQSNPRALPVSQLLRLVSERGLVEKEVYDEAVAAKDREGIEAKLFTLLGGFFLMFAIGLAVLMVVGVVSLPATV